MPLRSADPDLVHEWIDAYNAKKLDNPHFVQVLCELRRMNNERGKTHDFDRLVNLLRSRGRG